MNDHPDTGAVLASLKDFQRATVDHVFDRFFAGDGAQTRRFLVADEVGLGKTMVARGVIARTIDRLWDEVKRIDIIYICSNADIARQNIRRLGIPGCRTAAHSTRLTLLPLHLHDLEKSRINFVALTPSTSFEQSSGGGRAGERALLFWLLDRTWQLRGSKSALHVLRNSAGLSRIESEVGWLDDYGNINLSLADQFAAALDRQVQHERDNGRRDLRSRFEELQRTFCRVDSRVSREDQQERSRWLGEMRRLLAKVCLGALEPDLIILDEFQRFKHLLDEESEAGQLACHLFNWQGQTEPRVLLLSATPYRGLSLHHEAGEDHHADFVALVEFLEGGSAPGLKQLLTDYREALPALMSAEGKERLRRAKLALEARLSRVMARTERLTKGRGGMLAEFPARNAQLEAADLRAYLGTQRISDMMEQGDVVEYWKSAPYLFNFMDSYALKEAFREAAEDRDMVQIVRRFPEAFLDLDRVRRYQPVHPANSRLRSLIDDTVGQGMWKLLWLPPTMPYYPLSGPFCDGNPSRLTKRLVFSAWHMVPRAVAALVSYEAERRMVRARHPRAELTQEEARKQGPLLRFNVSGDRLSGLPLMLLVYPSSTLAVHFDPLDAARNGVKSSEDLLVRFADGIRAKAEALALEVGEGGPADERWYWVLPMLLDLAAFPEATERWWGRADLAGRWAGTDSTEDEESWQNHVERAKDTLHGVSSRALVLGPLPVDLYEVIALAASAAPATAALRAYARMPGNPDAAEVNLLDAAARSGRAFLSLFNHVEVTEMIRAEMSGEAYWRAVLGYAHAGCLQAVLDEYAHLLLESLGLVNVEPQERVDRIAEEIVSVVTLRTATLRVDEVSAPPYARNVEPKVAPMRIRFAMRFGDERRDEEIAPGDSGVGTRKERVRSSFNSPFWPFVLVSTSVGQEGLDFHPYCHAITHWNLPANPVDLEQREGRIHRYKGHAVRKNLVARFGPGILSESGGSPWDLLFQRARADREPGETDLNPFWVFDGDAKIERHVPALPFSREIDRLARLRKALTLYRMVFGQTRQEDLLAYLLSKVPAENVGDLLDELQIDLSPTRSRSAADGAADAAGRLGSEPESDRLPA